MSEPERAASWRTTASHSVEGDERSSAGTLFLERKSYRRRRLMDAAKLFPIIGAVLFSLPLVWQSGETTVPLSQVFVYVFIIWAGLIGINVLFWLGVTRWASNWAGKENDRISIQKPE